MPTVGCTYRNWKDTAFPGETKEHWDMRRNRNSRKASRKYRRSQCK